MNNKKNAAILKAEKIIDSSETLAQLNVALDYCNNFMILFRDYCSYQTLIERLKRKIFSIKVR